LTADQLLFVGFPPSRAAARRKWLSALRDEPRLIVLYEAPHRIRETLEDLRSVLGDRVVSVARELTKAHEELVVRPISQHLAELSAARGEYTVVIAPAAGAEQGAVALPDSSILRAEFGTLTKSDDGSRRDAVRRLAEKYRIPSRRMYELLETGRKD
jgi:16S rRNA (cytidine1402-2'-O)-methyltransferase